MTDLEAKADSYEEVLAKMMWKGRHTSSSSLARSLGISPQAFSNYKKRGRFGGGLMLKFADQNDVRYDWLIFGSGAPDR
jgi:hypothetical protein